MIDITGYITKTGGENGFNIKVTSDNIEYPPNNDIQVSKEVEVHINRYHYPSDNADTFERVSDTDNYRRDLIDTCRSLSRALRPGDRVKCSVFIVEEEIRNGAYAFVINTNRRDIQSYADFPLWLCPYGDRFERLEVDTPETLKFRRQNYYADINLKKCEKITGETWTYRSKKWVNKHPIRTFPRIWGIRFRTAVSKLWGKLRKENNLTIVLIITNIISIIGNIILTWLLFFKNLGQGT